MGHFHCDQISTPLALTDAEGNILWAATYDPWGNVLLALPPIVTGHRSNVINIASADILFNHIKEQSQKALFFAVLTPLLLWPLFVLVNSDID